MKIKELHKLYLPILFFLFFISITFLIEKKDEDTFTFSYEKFGLLFHIPISAIFIKKLTLWVLGICSLLSYIFYDFTRHFPQKFKMEVYFDESGIKECISLFSISELKKLNIIVDNIEDYQSKYYELINTEARKIIKHDFFTFNRKETRGEGETTFIVQKIEGIQNYDIIESKGELKHYIEIPNSKNIDCYTFFEKLKSPADKLDPTFKDIFIKNKIILKPRFKQIIAEKIYSRRKVFNHILGGYTVINIFPFPKVSNTLYLLEISNVGLIPIGYAVYK